MSARPALRRLARRLGILDGYVSQAGDRVATPDRARVALLGAMGVDASTEAAARRALAALDHERAERIVAPVQVVRAAGRAPFGVEVVLPPDLRDARAWTLEVREEGGAVRRLRGTFGRRQASPRRRLVLPTCPPIGYHRLAVSLAGPTGERRAEQSLIVAPPRCPLPRDRLPGGRGVGLCVNLYTVRSAENWGFGDCTDLRALVDWSAELGAAFVGLNPLHALRNTVDAISPYSPVSRLFRNVLYLDPTALPEFADSAEARAMVDAAGTRAVLADLRAADRIDAPRILALKLDVLRALHRTFVARHRAARTARGRAYAAYRAGAGDALSDFATFLALAATLGPPRGTHRSWRTWPAEYRDPRSPAVAAFRAAHAEEVDFHCYLQFALDAELARVAARGRARGLAIGLYEDLAIGSAPDGSDAWAFPGLFLAAASVGCPPDDYSRTGQDWGLPPLDPRRLAADGYGYWIRLLRSALAHAGALRIDHVMGLLRQYWVPAGRPGTEGAFVRFPSDDLLGILALEAARVGALVIGEDIGTVPRGFSQLLARWGILSSRVLYFERTPRGAFKRAAAFTARALLTANTHDMAPLAGYWTGRDLDLRRQAGIIADDRRLAVAHRRRAQERRGLLRRLAAEGLLPRAAEPATGAELRGAVHRFLRRTPAALVGLALDDLAGEAEPVNLPGVGPDRYPSWQRRMRRALEDLRTAPDVRTSLGGAVTRSRRATRARRSRA